MNDLEYIKRVVRTSAILTSSYVAGTIMGPQGKAPSADPVANNQLNLYINFTKGSLTSAEIKIEFSDDDTTYYRETSASVSSGISTDSLVEHKITTTGNYRIPVPLIDRYVKISVKGTGTVTNSLMTVDAIFAYRP